MTTLLKRLPSFVETFLYGERGRRLVQQTLRPGGQGLPSPDEAQGLEVARLPGFFSEADIRRVTTEAAKIRRTGVGCVQLASSGGGGIIEDENRGDWSTTYLHAHHLFQSRLPDIHARLVDAALTAERERGWNVIEPALEAHRAANARYNDDEPACLSTRCIEHHRVGPSGGLPHRLHFDSGSLVTIDVMLAEPDAGGEFETFECPPPAARDESHDESHDGGVVQHLHLSPPPPPPTQDGTMGANSASTAEATHISGVIKRHEFRRGDAVVFPSHKYHCVRPVREGVRQVLILELWLGRERRCNHRCEQHFGECEHGRGGGTWHAATGSSVAW